MRFDIITIFPEAFESYLNVSILKRARAKKLISVQFYNPRDFSSDKHRTVDSKPYGGGAGMVMMAEPILKAVSALRTFKIQKSKCKIIVLSAKGKQFSQKLAYDWSKKYDQLILISGRYEGIDERVKLALRAEEISIGPYVLTDGEIAAMTVISAVSRLIPGVIRLESLAEESHWNLLLKKEKNAPIGKGIEYPHYTRPERIKHKGKSYSVPKILLSGDHKKISEWRKGHV
ncbi:MAG: tRNA (guanosine(37)-N1)-methyltransferase TrmD [Candidatus Sungbacteria bacterium RIFCSPLOWO2_02_FULL_48_13b]|uniref:tRNA (guanine-N(1)-)-methyltransferase n=2 Tax=Candidatus Sungiibacteriota TaxID=1817917 RepID=A0A1G2LGG1_9BACT|nr:MAG: tRNA (guanosine(37)-N1)-methyltransferase TrmD [Candidatus Sungbacteria bacterium RIFCSPHIGHO2_02_FULL_49_20]OHA09922.1 MAG: tRNA (guanosine(37)-N1)-methyltransferase TrmD [Candidatus Sungbacteria bacterium RIFCSPLOWO2_02_FULL_48_13b]